MGPHDLAGLCNPAFFAEGDPHALWREMRRDAPVAWTPEVDGPGFWSVTRYSDGVRVFKDGAAFSVRAGTTLEGNRWEDDPGGDKMLALMDAPRHTEMRRLLAPFFSARRGTEMELHVRRQVRQLLERCASMGRFDFMEEVASRLPAAIFFSLMDIPAADWDRLSDTILRTVSADEGERYVADSELLMYLSALGAERHRRPGDDLLSAIAQASLEGRPLDEQEIVLSFANVLSAGIQTTRLSSGGGALALMEHPAQWARLCERPDEIPRAVEEVLRWTCPALAMCRTAIVDTEIAGQAVRRGERVAMWIPSLNRDELALDGADRFDAMREPFRHMTFGTGIHACLGAVFARLELRVLLEEMVTCWEPMELAGRPKRLCSLVLQGVDVLPVQARPRRGRSRTSAALGAAQLNNMGVA